MASEPVPEEELPPRLRFERLVHGPDATVFKSVRPEPAGVQPATGDTAPAPEADTPAVDRSILERFEALKKTMGAEIKSEPSAVRPDQTSYDELQRRIGEAKQQEAALREQLETAPDEPAVLAGPTYDEIEKAKVAEARAQQKAAKKERKRQKRKSRSFWAELPILILVALIVAIVIKTFFFQAFYIPSGSMIPTLQINDRVLVNKLSYQFGAVERGDILVFDSPEAIDVERSFPARVLRSIGEATGLTSPDTVLIKRVIALPGETVSILDNQVYVNGRPIAEPYLPDGVTTRDFEEIAVPADHVFMMGDNRNQSRDSRVFGPIPREDIVGRAFVTVWPPGAWGGL